MAKFGNKYFRNIGSASNKILQRLSFYRQTPGADFTFGGKSFDNIASSGVAIYQRLPSFYPSETGVSTPSTPSTFDTSDRSLWGGTNYPKL